MTRFEEIINNVIANKNKGKKDKKDVGVPGLTEDSDAGNPSFNFATDEQDLPLTEQLYRSGKHKPNDGSGATYWDSE